MGRATQVEMLLNGIRDTSGQPLASGKVYTYTAGTSTPATMYTDYTKTTPATNPIILDANGKSLVYADGTFKLIVKNSADVTLYTHDNLFFSYDDGTAMWAGTTTGSANAQAANLTPAINAYIQGMVVRFRAGYTNTNTVTLNLNGVGAKNIRLSDGSVAKAGQIIANGLYRVNWDSVSDSWILENHEAQASLAWTPTVTASGAMSIASSTINYSIYRISGNQCYVNVKATIQCGGVASNIIYFSLPFSASVTQAPPSVTGLTEGGTAKGVCAIMTTVVPDTKLAIYKYDSSNYSLATDIVIYINGQFTAS